jgi:hypothetical protein
MSGLFGWSLPPGVTSRMIDEAMGAEGPCAVCGESVDKCKCPECPECSDVGCIRHMSSDELWSRLAKLEALATGYKVELVQRGLPFYPDELDFDESEGPEAENA